MSKLIGTAGHIDHGKTTLIQALTGIDADRLPEEKKRGMTIDIGFAYIDLPGQGRVSIVDVPGHEKFLRNMLVGALGIDVALLCVAADESVMPQTREHFEILKLLPVDKMVVALTRSDLVDKETQELAQLEISEMLEPTRFKGCPIIPVSALKGVGLVELKTALAQALGAASAPDKGSWYLAVDRAFSVKGHGCVVTGTLARGEFKVGGAAVLQPGNFEVRIRGIHSHGEALETGERGKRTAVNLSGIKVEDVHRGMMLGEPGAVFETKCIDTRINWSTPPKHHDRVRVSIGSEEAIGRVFLDRENAEIAQFRFETPIAAALDQPLIVRRYSPPDLLGGGRVLVPQARPRRKSEQAKVVTAKDDAEAIVEAVGEATSGVSTEEVCRILGRTPQSLGAAFESLLRDRKLRGFAGLWFRPYAFKRATEAFLEKLQFLHEGRPGQSYHPREKAVSLAGLGWSGKALDRIITTLVEEGKIEASGTGVKLPGFKVQLTSRQREFLDRVVAEVKKEPVNTPSVLDLSRLLTVPPQAVEEIVKLGQQAGELVLIAQELIYTPAQVEALKQKVREVSGGKPFPASAFRDALGTTRKYAIPILEHFDATRFTARVGDLRVIKNQ